MERLHDRIISLRGKNRDHKTSSDFNKPGKWAIMYDGDDGFDIFYQGNHDKKLIY
jgi:hypothetical protein